jgi:hypothetical protein
MPLFSLSAVGPIVDEPNVAPSAAPFVVSVFDIEAAGSPEAPASCDYVQNASRPMALLAKESLDRNVGGVNTAHGAAPPALGAYLLTGTSQP